MAVCSLYNRGFSIQRSGIHFADKKGGGKRGKLQGKYSSASFRRLREFVIKHQACGDCWGITLTVPGLDNLSVMAFKKLQHKFCNWANMKKIPLVWRAELQQRGMPHLHCVVYGSVESCFMCASEWFKVLRPESVWSIEQVGIKQVDLVEMPRSFVHGSSHAFNLVRLDGGFSAFRYLVAHMSKGKKEQLGYAGRNWGVVHRSAFIEENPEKIVCSDRAYYSILRYLRRMTRRRVLASSGCACWVSDSAVLRRMLEYEIERDSFSVGSESAVRKGRARGISEYWLFSSFGLDWIQRIDFLQFFLLIADMRSSILRLMQDVLVFFGLYYWEERIPF